MLLLSEKEACSTICLNTVRSRSAVKSQYSACFCSVLYKKWDFNMRLSSHTFCVISSNTRQPQRYIPVSGERSKLVPRFADAREGKKQCPAAANQSKQHCGSLASGPAAPIGVWQALCQNTKIAYTTRCEQLNLFGKTETTATENAFFSNFIRHVPRNTLNLHCFQSAITKSTIRSQLIMSCTGRECYRYGCHGEEPLPTMIKIYKKQGRKGVKDLMSQLSSTLYYKGIRISNQSNQTGKFFHGQEDMTSRRQPFMGAPHIFLIQSALRVSPGA